MYKHLLVLSGLIIIGKYAVRQYPLFGGKAQFSLLTIGIFQLQVDCLDALLQFLCRLIGYLRHFVTSHVVTTLQVLYRVFTACARHTESQQHDQFI